MAWRLAGSLEQLRSEVNARWPNRSKRSDGTIGDPRHAASSSDHNPNPQEVVCAFDITNDPTNGPNIEQLGDQIRRNPNPQCKYVIYNGKIASRMTQWATRPYTGDPHTSHIHVSVGIGTDGKSRQPYDDRTPWLAPIPPQKPPTAPETHDMTPATLTDTTGRVWRFTVGTNGAVWAKVDTSDWFSLAGQFTSGLDATETNPDGSIEVCGRGTDGALWAIQSNSASDFAGKTWFTLGGTIHA